MSNAETPASILVVDDEPLVLESLRLLLDRRWLVFTAGSAAEAKEILAREEIAVVISDQRMPIETGVQLLSWAHQHAPRTIRMLLTAYTDVETVIKAINEGRVWHYIRKPWDNRDVETLIQRGIEYRQKVIEVERNFFGTIRALVVALEASHRYTCGHSGRVTRYATLLCDALGLPPREIDVISLAAQLHDIGKIGVDNRYLDKDGRLSDEEWREVRAHVTTGQRILVEAGVFDEVIPSVVTHHERLDGRGYPGGLAGDAIPLGGRIIGIADAFDAMTSSRAYRGAMSPAAAIAELRDKSGTQFDPALVAAFCDALAAADRLYASAEAMPDGAGALRVSEPRWAVRPLGGPPPGTTPSPDTAG